MNIVHLEGRLEGINSIKRTLRGQEAHRFDMDYRVQRKITELTGKLTPQELLKRLFNALE